MDATVALNRSRWVWGALLTGAAAFALIGLAHAWDDDEHHSHLQLQSSDFADDGTLPVSAVFTIPNANGQNSCTADGSPGGDLSPELHWSHAPRETRSFVVILYDVTAAFTHWGMYNIPADTTSLPQNAGAPGSDFGIQVSNDFGDVNYDGPCPPVSAKPFSHQYVFTIYALDRKLPELPAHGDFPAGSEALYHALINAARENHILETASLTGFYSAVAPGQ